jgi:hypothetical protein
VDSSWPLLDYPSQVAVFAFLFLKVMMTCSVRSTDCSDVIIAGAVALAGIWIVALARRYSVNVRPIRVARACYQDSLVVDDDCHNHDLTASFSVHPAHSFACLLEDSNIMHRYYPFFIKSCLGCYMVIDT